MSHSPGRYLPRTATVPGRYRRYLVLWDDEDPFDEDGEIDEYNVVHGFDTLAGAARKYDPWAFGVYDTVEDWILEPGEWWDDEDDTLPVTQTRDAICREPARCTLVDHPMCKWCGTAHHRPRSPYCNKDCAQKASRAKQVEGRLRRYCFECRGEMSPARSSAAFCSDACRKRSWRKRDGAP